MGKFLFRVGLLFIVVLYTCTSILHAQDSENKIQLSAGAGYQRENFHWSIAGNANGQNPNVYSELKWKAIEGNDYDFALQWNPWHRFLLLADYNRSLTTAGTSNDTDYQGDNRTNPIYNQSFNSNKGGTSAWAGGIGYLLFKNKVWRISPYLGYGINYQSYYLLGNDGDFGQLNSSYKTQWRGPFIKVISVLNITNRFKLAADLTYSQVTYSAAADWNLIETFQHPVSFRHSADGYGIDAGAKLVFKINHFLSANIGAAYFNWETGNGTDQLYLTTGETDKTQLNGVVRNGFKVSLGVNLQLGRL
jgi:hypothetical protein